MNCAAETASPLMPASGLKSHRALPHIHRDKKRSHCVHGDSTLLVSFWRHHSDVAGSKPGKQNTLLGSGTFTRLSCADCPDAAELGQLKACVHAYSIAQLVTQDALFTVVGQLEQVEAC